MYHFSYAVPETSITVDFDATGQEDFMLKLHKLQEILLENTCGKCGKHRIVIQVRTVDKYTYYELKCKDCGAILQFGKTDDGLYPRRYEMDGTKPKLDAKGEKVWLPDGGWIKWDSKQKKYV